MRGIAPKLGLKPTTPQKAAGRITEPAVWVPMASGTMPGGDRGGRAGRGAAGRVRRVARVAGRRRRA